jgi:hypothetical protein
MEFAMDLRSTTPMPHSPSPDDPADERKESYSAVVPIGDDGMELWDANHPAKQKPTAAAKQTRRKAATTAVETDAHDSSVVAAVDRFQRKCKLEGRGRVQAMTMSLQPGIDRAPAKRTARTQPVARSAAAADEQCEVMEEEEEEEEEEEAEQEPQMETEEAQQEDDSGEQSEIDSDVEVLQVKREAKRNAACTASPRRKHHYDDIKESEHPDAAAGAEDLDADEEHASEDEEDVPAVKRRPKRQRTLLQTNAYPTSARGKKRAMKADTEDSSRRGGTSSQGGRGAGAALAPASSSYSSRGGRQRRDNRRDKRISGWGLWRQVHPNTIPAMTYEGFEDLATDTLEEETLEDVRNSKPYEPDGHDAYHADPWRIIKGIDQSPLHLFRRVDTKYGRIEYKVKASRNIEPKEVIAFLGGRLMEQVKANKQIREEWNQMFFMDRDWLDKFFEYKGRHSLVISTKDHKCLASYIRPPEHRDDGDGPNVKADVTFDEAGLFFVVYYAVEKIKKGQEVFCIPFLGQWQSRCHREMFLASRVSHWYHKWAHTLEIALQDAGIEFDHTAPPEVKPQILTPEQEEKFLNIPGYDQGVIPEQTLDEDKCSSVWDVAAAMEYAGCTYSATAKLDVSTETLASIRAVGEYIPSWLNIKISLGDDGETETRHIRVDVEEVRRVIETGFRPDCMELREDLSIHSPVRHFTPPNFRAFYVAATTYIPVGTFVFCYAGEITEEVRHRNSCYVYAMDLEEIRRYVRAYSGPSLTLDALKVGNISRFVNDNTYRAGEEESKGSTANLETQFLFYQGSIHLGFYTTRDIEPDEELISSYGEDYWKTVNKQLISGQMHYFNYANVYTRKLEQILVRHNLPLPPLPPYKWEGEAERFEQKVLDYPNPLRAGQEEEDVSGDQQEMYEVERILAKRVDSKGAWYKVRMDAAPQYTCSGAVC